MAKIKSIKDLLKMELNIPNYQRPYKWENKNIEDLLSDISIAINESTRYTNFKYRIGTIILHNINSRKKNVQYDIVDGQQRVISLTLLYLCLNPNFDNSILKIKFDNIITQKNINDNFRFLKEWFALKDEACRKSFLNALEQTLEVVIIVVDRADEAFQLFDSQNSRGKSLDPHDLLKAYHLREMRNDLYEMEHSVEVWESKKSSEIRDLFDIYLYPIINWSLCRKTKDFTSKEIDIFKGIKEDSAYTYAKRAFKSMPYFQITEPFIAGNSFFEMVDHYLEMLADINRALEEKFADLNKIVENKKYNESVGFTYAKELFKCVLLCYYDRFHNFEEMAVKKLFIWSFMIRVDMENLGYDTINRYAIGVDDKDAYTNKYAMFSIISNARKHTDISNLKIYLKQDKRTEKWEPLRKQLGGYLSF